MDHDSPAAAEGGKWAPGWNWAAFLHSTGWFWYRRMYGWSILNLIAPVLVTVSLTLVVQGMVPESYQSHVFGAGLVAYFLFVFLVVPAFADSLYRQVARKPPSWLTALGALLIIAIPACIAYAVAMAQIEYSHRERVSEGLHAAVSLREAVNEFYAEERSLPGPQEAAQFLGRDPLKHTASVGWDPGRRSIVVVMGEKEEGLRFELAAVERDGALQWTCRTIDLDSKYLPASCR